MNCEHTLLNSVTDYSHEPPLKYIICEVCKSILPIKRITNIEVFPSKINENGTTISKS